jgi:hypothetical protein
MASMRCFVEHLAGANGAGGTARTLIPQSMAKLVMALEVMSKTRSAVRSLRAALYWRESMTS